MSENEWASCFVDENGLLSDLLKDRLLSVDDSGSDSVSVDHGLDDLYDVGLDHLLYDGSEDSLCLLCLSVSLSRLFQTTLEFLVVFGAARKF